jgi:hypothetical protein
LDGWHQTSPFDASADAFVGLVFWQATDSFGCLVSDTIAVIEPNELIVGMGLNAVTGLFEIQVAGGTQPYDTLYTLNGAQQPNPMQHTAEGLYEVLITDANGCTANAGFYLYAVGTTKVLAEEVRVYPNPVSDNLTIDFGSFDGQKTIEIFNAIGQLAKSKVSTEGEISVDVSRFASGTYLVRVVSAGQATIYRIVKK